VCKSKMNSRNSEDDQDDWTERWPFIRSESIVLNTKSVADELIEIWCR
jgi:hypothetical protein